MSDSDIVGVLVVEDDASVGEGLVVMLAGAGYQVRWARDCADAKAFMAAQPVDLVLLDLGLPDGEGLEICRGLRKMDDVVVIVVVTARTDEADAVLALDAGADDFVAKPFRKVELLARLRAHLRRREVVGVGEMRVGGLRLDVRSRRAYVDEEEMALRPREFELLQVLVRSAGEAVRREQLMDEVWDQHWSGSTKTLDVHIANLRRKLADAGDRWDRIVTLRGFGYRFAVD